MEPKLKKIKKNEEQQILEILILEKKEREEMNKRLDILENKRKEMNKHLDILENKMEKNKMDIIEILKEEREWNEDIQKKIYNIGKYC